jgi:hypothetical protein
VEYVIIYAICYAINLEAWRSTRYLQMKTKTVTLGIILLSLAVGAALPFAYGQITSTFPFHLPSSSLVNCWFFGVAFQATQGQAITFQWSENLSSAGPISMDFYIVPANSFRVHWFCDQGPTYVYWNNGAYGIAKWNPPSTDRYAAILVNYGYNTVSGAIVVTSSATISAYALGPTPVRNPCYSQACTGP